MADIIVTLLWEKSGEVFRRYEVCRTGEQTPLNDVPLPKHVELNFQEELILGARMTDSEKSARRGGKNDIIVCCTHIVVNPRGRSEKSDKLVNFQPYWVLDKRYTAEALAKDHLEQCLALGIPMRRAYPLPTPTEWAFEVWVEDGDSYASFNLARALLREMAHERAVDITFANSATDYA